MTPGPGAGLAWRPETAWLLERHPVALTEVLAENLRREVPHALHRLRDRGTAIAVHGVGLGLGDPTRPCPDRLALLARLRDELGAGVISEHIAWVRAGGRESGHLLPVPRTDAMLDRLCDHIDEAQDALGHPLVLENIACPLAWPEDDWSEAAFVAEVLRRTGAGLLLDLSNLWANACNHGFDPVAALDELPLDRLAYVHLAGGEVRDGWYHDTHASRLPRGPLQLLGALVERVGPVPALLEWDRDFPGEAVLRDELAQIAAALEPEARRVHG